MYSLASQPNVDLVLSASTHLFAWQAPDLPEDLFFLLRDGSPLLTTTAHEDHAHLSLDAAQLKDLLRDLPWMAEATETMPRPP
jgi:hypothetical protein